MRLPAPTVVTQPQAGDQNAEDGLPADGGDGIRERRWQIMAGLSMRSREKSRLPTSDSRITVVDCPHESSGRMGETARAAQPASRGSTSQMQIPSVTIEGIGLAQVMRTEARRATAVASLTHITVSLRAIARPSSHHRCWKPRGSGVQHVFLQQNPGDVSRRQQE